MKKRIEYIDNIKALAIILVVLGHFLVEFKTNNYDFYGISSYIIYCFHMPLFFILSGWSYACVKMYENFKQLIIRCANLLYASILFVALKYVFIYFYNKQLISGISLINFLTLTLKEYWFITVLVVIYLCIYFYYKLFKKVTIKTSYLLLIISYIISFFNMEIAKLILYLFFFSIGILIFNKEYKVSKKNMIISSLIFIVVSITNFYLNNFVS